MSATNDPPAPPPPEPPAAPPSAPTDGELAGLDDRTRAVVERYITRANDASGEAGRYRHELRETQERLTKLERERETEQERRDREVGERERAAGRAERDDEVSGLRREVATAAIRVRAAGRFADPEDAVRMLDLDSILAEHDERKRVDLTDRALDDLLKAKPYLARERERGPLVTQGGRSQPPDGRPRERSWLRG
jgi:hypothetical protein